MMKFPHPEFVHADDCRCVTCMAESFRINAEHAAKLDAELEPLCPDSPDGNHHVAPIGSDEEWMPSKAPCYYCGDKQASSNFSSQKEITVHVCGVKCDHQWDGPQEEFYGNGITATCSKCGAWAVNVSMMEDK